MFRRSVPLNFSDFKSSFDLTSKQILVDNFSKLNNRDGKFKIRGNEYQQYMIARGYKPNKQG